MDKLPLISVIIPVYKVEAYLDKCISSVSVQTYENLDIILVDDGSPDNCPAMCDVWAEKDNRIRVIHQKNAGGGAARNAALDIAKGDLIAFVDSDDYIAEDMYAHLFSLLEQGADVAECGYINVTDGAAVFQECGYKAQEYTAEE
ncbi:MAG: glycosyltransferase, partial [Hominenteromicrobium sp.]